MDKIEKLNVIVAWNEADEIREDLAFSDDDIIKMIPKIRERIKIICERLDMFTIDEYEEVYPERCGKGLSQDILTV